MSNRFKCPHVKIEKSLDRLSEAHWHIHQIENNYHYPQDFRYSFNSFLRSIREMPDTLLRELQNQPNYKFGIKPKINRFFQDPLFFKLKSFQDFLVHNAGMLDIKSGGFIAATEGRIIKMQIPYQIYNHETSQEAYDRFKDDCKKNKFLRNLVGPDCDSWPMLRREWKLPGFEDELLDLSVKSWRLSAEIVQECLLELGGSPVDLSLSCLHDSEKVKVMEFSQEDFFRSVDNVEIN